MFYLARRVKFLKQADSVLAKPIAKAQSGSLSPIQSLTPKDSASYG